MVDLGVVTELWRYPVKSLQGERVVSLAVASGGAEGDRTHAIVDPGAKKVLSAKRYPELLLASARLVAEEVVITLPDGSEHGASDPGVHSVLSDWLDRPVRLERPPAEGVFPMEMHTGMSDEDTPIFDWPGPEGTWLDLADAHWLTTASLRSIAAQHPAGEWEVRRFRPTALIETAPDSGEFPEEGWGLVELGEVASEVFMATPRCTMPSRAQPGLSRDKAIGTAIRDTNQNNLGVYASITRGGTIREGDPVRTG